MRNVGTTDSRARLVLGAGLFLWAFFAQGFSHWVFLVLGAILFLTAFARFCPLWFGLGLNTHRAKSQPKKA